MTSLATRILNEHRCLNGKALKKHGRDSSKKKNPAKCYWKIGNVEEKK